MTNGTLRLSALAASLLLLAACGGGGGGGGGPQTNTNVSIEGPTPAPIEANSILISDMLLSGLGISERVSNVSCTPSGLCQATYQGEVITFEVETDPDDQVSGTLYTSLGKWSHMNVAAAYVRIDAAGLQARYAVAAGVVHPNSIPRGTATWTGDMVGLDSNNRLVRGGASIRLVDFGDPRVDVALSPQARPVMVWRGLAVRDGGFRERRAVSDYIKGQFYGPRAEEVGGVFERNRIVGAFGALRQ